jgi:predicted alpha/beta-hydrolase family hydrolase
VTERTVGKLIALAPDHPRALLVLAHGADAGMRHAFMESMAEALAERGMATLRYPFPYMEAGKKRPDPAPVLEATVAAAVAEGARRFPTLPLFAGGKSMGGRMTSRAASQKTLAAARGLVFLGFPLHRKGDLSDERAAHLSLVSVPMLFVQGTRDELAALDRIRAVVARLGPRATLHVVEGGDHSFSVRKRSGRTNAQVIAEIATAVSSWMSAH